MARKKTGPTYFEAVGRRKSATCRVRLFTMGKDIEVTSGEAKLKKGDIYVNDKKANEYFPGNVFGQMMLLPFKLTNTQDRFAVTVHVRGGGQSGQLEAMLLSTSRALLKVDDAFRPILKKSKLLTRDDRTKERRKVGTGGKARRKKQSPKR